MSSKYLRKGWELVGEGENNRRQFEYNDKDRETEIEDINLWNLCFVSSSVSLSFSPFHLSLTTSSYSLFLYFFYQSLISNLFFSQTNILYKYTTLNKGCRRCFKLVVLQCHHIHTICSCRWANYKNTSSLFVLVSLSLKSSPMIQNEMRQHKSTSRCVGGGIQAYVLKKVWEILVF